MFVGAVKFIDLWSDEEVDETWGEKHEQNKVILRLNWLEMTSCHRKVNVWGVNHTGDPQAVVSIPALWTTIQTDRKYLLTWLHFSQNTRVSPLKLKREQNPKVAPKLQGPAHQQRNQLLLKLAQLAEKLVAFNWLIVSPQWTWGGAGAQPRKPVRPV